MARAAKKKDKVGACSINEFWKSLNRLVPEYLDKKNEGKKKYYLELKRLEEQANKSDIPEFIAENFVRPYLTNGLDKLNVNFSGTEKGNSFGTWTVLYDKDTKTLRISVVGIYLYSSFCKDIEFKLNKLDAEDNFTEYRLLSLNKEIAKLPGQYILFITVLKGVAEAASICVSDSKSAANNPDKFTLLYLSTLWALKQFEDFYLKVQNRNIRSDYFLVWHEGEWIG